MLDIEIVAVGKMKDRNLAASFSEYIKRLSPYGRIKITELKAMSFSEGNRHQIRKKESARLVEYIESGNADTKVIMAETGKSLDSAGFSKWLADRQGSVLFVVGGALGLDESVRKAGDLVLSLSDMTFPHEMARVMLAEQLYRAAMIARGKTYHY